MRFWLVDYSRDGLSGVHTFTETFVRHLSRFEGFRYIALPGEKAAGVAGAGDSTDANPPPCARVVSKPGIMRLGAGYFRRVLRECRMLRQRGLSMRSRLVLVNEFGCETLPLAVRLAAPRARIVALAHTHPGVDAGARHPVRRLTEWLCARVCRKVVFNSEANARLWAERPGASRYQGQVIHYGLPMPEAPKEEDDLGALWPPKGDGVLDVVSVSRMVRWKGHHELIESWKRVPKDCLARLIIVGDGPERSECEARVRAVGLADRVLFLGAQAGAAHCFWKADIAIHTPIEPEAFGLVVLEAMNRGVPVIASKIGGIPEFVDETCGVLIDPHDYQGVADAVVRLVGDAALRRRMGAAGRERFLAGFTEMEMLVKYEAVIQEAKTEDG